MSTQSNSENRESFKGRGAFLLAAIGSAVGLGNIWRFPYTAYENGGGAFIIPYLVALLTAGIPFLFLDIAIGHKFRAGSPLSFRRMNKSFEPIGWWHVLINFVICAYYAVIFTWAVIYTFYSISKAWGNNPTNFFVNTFLHNADVANGISFDFVGLILISVVVIWVLTLGVLALGVQKGISASSNILMPLLVIMFVGLVIYSLFLPGAEKGLEAFFKPDWSKLADSKIWIAAYGQIFFSLSIGFGIMITYASYLDRKTDLSGTGLVIGFANSAFEILAGIGVFAALGFMAMSSGQEVNEVAKGGIGLAFFAYPTILNNAPFGEIIGVLFFGSLAFAAFTSLVSLVEVITAGIQEKLKLSRVKTIIYAGIPLTITSVVLFTTTTGLSVLDVMDKYINYFGIVASAVIALLLILFTGKLKPLAEHINSVSSFKVGKLWMFFLGVTSVILLFMLFNEAYKLLTNGYDGYPSWLVNSFGWGMSIVIVLIAFWVSSRKWPAEIEKETPESFAASQNKGE